MGNEKMTNDNDPKQEEELRAFIRALSDRIWEVHDITAADLLELMVKHHVMHAIVEIEPCVENCFCMREFGEDAFPLTCYKLAIKWL